MVQNYATEKNFKTGRWFMCLFGLPFACVSLGLIGWSIIPTLLDWYAMQTWQPVQATVLAADLETHTGDNSTTYKAFGTYRYQFHDQTYISNRIGISDGSDNIGSYQQDRAFELKQAQELQQPITVYVNPAAPDKSVYYRELRAGLLTFKLVFAAIFGLVGFALMGIALFMKTGPASSFTVNEVNGERIIPDAPTAWSSPTIICSGKGGAISGWFFAAVWNLLCVPISFLAIPDELAKGNQAILFLLLFDAVGLVLLASAIHKTLQWKKFGNVSLTLDPHPGSIGGHVAGFIDTPSTFRIGQAFTIELVCLRTYQSGTGKERETRQEAVWQDIRHFQGYPLAEKRFSVPFCFDVPEGLPASQPASDNYHHWQLQAKAETDGVDFEQHWDIPVFATAQLAPIGLVAQDIPPTDSDVDTSLHLRHTGGGIEMDYPTGRSASTALTLLIFTLIFGGAFYLMITQAKEAPLVILIAFGFTTAMLLACSIWLAGNRLKTSLQGSRWKIERFLFGIPVWEKQLSASEIDGISHNRGMQSQSGLNVKVYYRLTLKTRSGETFIIGDGFVGHSAITQATERLASLTHLKLLAPDKTTLTR